MPVALEKQHPITIVVICDNNYVILLAALIKSIEVHHKTGERLEFYVIHDSVSKKNQEKLQRSIDPAMTSLKWICRENVIPANFTLPAYKSWYPSTVLLRLFIPDILPQSSTKVLYMDVDMIAQTDISRLWHTDLGDCAVGAVQDINKTVCAPWAGIPNHLELGIPKGTSYFNSGLLLINVKKWRELRVAESVLKVIQENRKYANLPDQYGLNVVLFQKWLPLDPLWNTYATWDEQHPFIIHFLTIKPIYTSYKSNPRYQQSFFNYLNMTAWKNARMIGGYKWLWLKAYNKIKKNWISIKRFIE